MNKHKLVWITISGVELGYIDEYNKAKEYIKDRVEKLESYIEENNFKGAEVLPLEPDIDYSKCVTVI